MTYAYPDISSIPAMMVAPNDVTGGMFWTMILMAFWVVVFITVYASDHEKRQPKSTSRAFAGASFPSCPISILMTITTPALVSPFVAAVFSIMMIFSIGLLQVD